MRLTYARFMCHFNWNEYLPSFTSEVAEVSLLLPVANESAMTVLSTILVVCTVNHFDLLVEYFDEKLQQRCDALLNELKVQIITNYKF